MASSTIIELKELQRGKKQQTELPNGYFKQILRQPVTIEEGDQISIKAGFIDTIQSSQGKIIIDGTENFKIGYTPFIQNTNKIAKVFNGRAPSDTEVNPIDFDNKAYYGCAGGHTPTGNLVTIETITFYRVPSDTQPWGKETGYFTFNNEVGAGSGITVTLPPIDSADDVYIYTVNKVCQDGTFKFDAGDLKTLKKFLNKGHIKFYTVQSTPYTPSVINLEPLAFEYSFQLPKGSYEPKHICELITENLTNMQNVSTSEESPDSTPVNNAFLKTNFQMNAQAGAYTGEGNTIYVSEDGTSILQLPSSQHYPAGNTDAANIVPGFGGNTFETFVGSDQVVLEFDEDLQKCVWSQLHSNIYSEGSSDGGSGYNEDGSIVIKAFPFSYTGGSEYIYGSRHSCIGFNYLEPADFWYGKLGLDPGICFSFEPHLKNQVIGAFSNIDTYKIKGGLLEGVHTTDSVVSSSVAITKNQFYNQVPARSSLAGVSTANVKCYGLNSLNTPTLEEGYFLISIDGFDNNQNLINKYDEKQTIKSIVSRFYTTNSYTSFYSEGNVETYTHQGQPITLSSFTVKILNPEYEAANIQDDNTIFLELVKPLPQLKQ